jgi:hypothetical protein
MIVVGCCFFECYLVLEQDRSKNNVTCLFFFFFMLFGTNIMRHGGVAELQRKQEERGGGGGSAILLEQLEKSGCLPLYQAFETCLSETDRNWTLCSSQTKAFHQCLNNYKLQQQQEQ